MWTCLCFSPVVFYHLQFGYLCQTEHECQWENSSHLQKHLPEAELHSSLRKGFTWEGWKQFIARKLCIWGLLAGNRLAGEGATLPAHSCVTPVREFVISPARLRGGGGEQFWEGEQFEGLGFSIAHFKVISERFEVFQEEKNFISIPTRQPGLACCWEAALPGAVPHRPVLPLWTSALCPGSAMPDARRRRVSVPRCWRVDLLFDPWITEFSWGLWSSGLPLLWKKWLWEQRVRQGLEMNLVMSSVGNWWQEHAAGEVGLVLHHVVPKAP